MAKALWNDLQTRVRQPYLVAAVLSQSSDSETLLSAHSSQRLLARLIRKLPPKADFALTVSRQTRQREILCAFADASDARLFANITNASVVGSASYSFLLDESTEENLLQIAGPPEPHRRPRVTT